MCAQSWWRGIPPVLLLVALLSVPAYAGESVRSQLIRLQNENGLRLVTLAPPYGFVGVPLSGEAVNQVMFETRSLNQEKQVLPPSVEVRLPSSISPDGSQIALNLTMRSGDKYTGTILVVIGFDGHVIGKYAYVYNASDASAICWSPDNSKIALNAMDPRVKPCKPALRILDLKSGAFDEVDGASQSSVTNECWSPDGQRLVYTHWDGDDTDIRLYDVSKKTWVSLEKEGWGATWSPDGNWVALRSRELSEENGPFRLISADRSRPARSLKYRGDGPGALWWSPDSRFVAYVSWAGLGDGF